MVPINFAWSVSVHWFVFTVATLPQVVPPSAERSTEYDAIAAPLSFGIVQSRTTTLPAAGVAVNPVGASGESAIVTLADDYCAHIPASLTVATL